MGYRDLLDAIKEREDLRKSYKKFKIGTTLRETAYNNFKSVRARAKKMADYARSEFSENKLYQHRNDPKKYWESIFEIMPSKRGKTSGGRINLIESNSGEEIEGNKTAEFINEFFAGIGDKLASKFQEAAGVNGGTVIGVTTNEVLDDMRAFDQQTKQYVKDINIYKSSGVKNILTRI